MSRRRLKPFAAPPFAVLHRPDDPWVHTLDLHGVRQSKNYSCGFASVRMVTHFFGDTTSAEKLYEDLGTDRHGTSQASIIRTLRENNVRATIRYDLNFERVKRSIHRGKIIIAYLADDEHWLVVYGVGENPQRLFVADPRPEFECEVLWDNYAERLKGFGIVCSESPRQHDVEVEPESKQTQLQLAF